MVKTLLTFQSSGCIISAGMVCPRKDISLYQTHKDKTLKDNNSCQTFKGFLGSLLEDDCISRTVLEPFQHSIQSLSRN